MEARKKQAERALAAFVAESGQSSESSSGDDNSGSSSGGGSASAESAPRNSDGSWPPESCSVNDPTPADGCITPRTLHALQQAKAAGFTRYVSCHRNGGSGEHPRGRACDFAAQKNGFGGVAAGRPLSDGQPMISLGWVRRKVSTVSARTAVKNGFATASSRSPR